MAEQGYYRFPTIHDDTIVFGAEDDLWTVPAGGGVARRLTANQGRTMAPSFSPDGKRLAFVGLEEGQPEVYVMPAQGGPAERLTFLGAPSQATTWLPDGAGIVFASDAGQPFPGTHRLYAVSPEGGPPRMLDTGPAASISFGPAGGRVIGRHTADIARWKRYRGGLTGDLWIDAEADGRWRRLVDLEGNVARPLWLRDRIYFVSDHEGVGNLYSCSLTGADLRRHSAHQDYYVRHPSTDGRRIVYHAGADLYVFDPERDAVERIDFDFHSPRVQRRRRFVGAEQYLQSYDLHPGGHRMAVVSRGRPFSFFNWEGAVLQHGEPQGVRYRLAAWLHDGERIAVVSDAAGEERIEVHGTEVQPLEAPVALDGLDIGRPVSLHPSPRYDELALTNHRNELILVDLVELTAKVLDVSRHDRIRGVAWSPDGLWLAYGFSDTSRSTRIRLCRLDDGECFDATRPVLRDMMPSFDPAGRYLYFLSLRDFDPVYDNLHFDLGFPFGMRPHLVTLQSDLPSPFIPQPKPLVEDDEDDEDGSEGDEPAGAGDGAATETETEAEAPDLEDDEDSIADEHALEAASLRELRGAAVSRRAEHRRSRRSRPAAGGASRSRATANADAEGRRKDGSSAKGMEAATSDAASADVPVDESLIRIDLEGIQDRVIGFPVPEGHYGRIAGIQDKVLYTTFPLNSTLSPPDESGSGGTIECFDLEAIEESTLVEPADDFTLSLDAKSMAYRSGRMLRVMKAGQKPGKDGPPGRKTGWIDLGRIRISVDPKSEWEQMYREAWRLQRDQFWTPDMSGVDWQQVYSRYLPLIQRVSTRAEFSDLMWEMQGELGTSHAYEAGGDYRPSPSYAQGYLGVDFDFDEADERYTVAEIIRGDVWDEKASSPLARPGIDVRPGDRLIAVGGRRVDKDTQPAELLVNQARNEVTLTFAPREEAADEDRKDRSTAGPSLRSTSTGDGAEKRPSAVVAKSASKEAPAPAQPEGGAEAGASNQAAPRSFNVTVKTLSDERRARYRDWVEANRATVLEATTGRVGYVHVPDMGPRGYAEFHRGFLSEIQRDGLIVDVRFNAGGHVSQLILEKLARRRLGYDVQRWGEPLPYPAESVLGPIVALTNEYAGSDGDMFSHAFKLMQLGPLIGKRTWGGVVGIHPREAFVDGGYTTQPEFSMWFQDVGFTLENYGTEPDIEVEFPPQDHVAGEDPQLQRAIQEILQRMTDEPPELPEFGERPRLPLPRLPMDGVEGSADSARKGGDRSFDAKGR